MMKCIMGLHSNLTLLCSRPVHPTNIFCRSALGRTLFVSAQSRKRPAFPACCFPFPAPAVDVAEWIGTWVFSPDRRLRKIPLRRMVTPLSLELVTTCGFSSCPSGAASRLWSKAAPRVGRAAGRGGVCGRTHPRRRAGCWALWSWGSRCVLSALYSAGSGCLRIWLSLPAGLLHRRRGRQSSPRGPLPLCSPCPANVEQGLLGHLTDNPANHPFLRPEYSVRSQ